MNILLILLINMSLYAKMQSICYRFVCSSIEYLSNASRYFALSGALTDGTTPAISALLISYLSLFQGEFLPTLGVNYVPFG